MLGGAPERADDRLRRVVRVLRCTLERRVFLGRGKRHKLLPDLLPPFPKVSCAGRGKQF